MKATSSHLVQRHYIRTLKNGKCLKEFPFCAKKVMSQISAIKKSGQCLSPYSWYSISILLVFYKYYSWYSISFFALVTGIYSW